MSENNLKIRIKFKKHGIMRFVGHLDTVRYFQKAMRRANIDIAYSEGFSPHQIMSFAAPMGVGMTSDGEYLDIEAVSTISTKESIERLNNAMVPGVEISDFRLLPPKTINAMASVTCADYILSFREGHNIPTDIQTFKTKINEFYTNATEIRVQKQTKKNVVEIDLKELVYAFEVREDEKKNPCFYIKCSTGSMKNIKPELVMTHFYDFCGFEMGDFDFCVHRLDVYTGEKESGFIPLSEMGEIIP